MRGEVQKFLGDYIPDPMFNACQANRDAFIKLLLSACEGTDNTMGSPDMPGIFWENFTKRWVQDLKLDIVITKETVATCENFGSSLKDLHLRMKKTYREIEKHHREQLCQPLQLKQPLFQVFGIRKPRFWRKKSSGSSSKSAGSSKSAMSSDASRLSDARGPSGASQSLRQDVNDVVSGMAKAKEVHIKDVYRVVTFFTSCDATAKVFLEYDPEERLFMVKDYLNGWNQLHLLPRHGPTMGTSISVSSSMKGKTKLEGRESMENSCCAVIQGCRRMQTFMRTLMMISPGHMLQDVLKEYSRPRYEIETYKFVAKK
ncbi:hypothetical protein Tco_0014427 [Tanacetum coccineum]